MDDSTICEEYTEDAPFVGRSHDRPPPSFHIGHDIFVGYFLIVRSTNGNLCPFQVAWAVTNLNLNPGHRNQNQIQYRMPNTFECIDADTYSRWDSKEGNVWYEGKGFLPCWSYTNCVMTAWTSRVCSKTLDLKMRISAKQISIFKASLKAYESHSDNE